MAIYHLSIKIVSRGKGKSAVAAAAYRAGQKITNEYDGIEHDYTRKGGVVHTEILLPGYAPVEYASRAVLWNSVERIEKAKNSQLAREIELALPVELTREQNISLVRDYVKRIFVNSGMCADICIHDKNDGNPHAHIMLTMRPIEPDGAWGAKSKKEYILDEHGRKIVLKSGEFKTRKIEATDWNEQTKAEEWRAAWADAVNTALERQDISERIDHRSFVRQGVAQIPTVHLGVVASQMEKRGIVTARGNINRAIHAVRQKMHQLWMRIAKLKDWLKDEFAYAAPAPSTPIIPPASVAPSAPPTLVDMITDILARREQTAGTRRTRTTITQAGAEKIIAFLNEHQIKDATGLEEKFRAVCVQHATVRGDLKLAEQTIYTLDEHIKQAGVYLQHKDVYREYLQITKPKRRDAFERVHQAAIILCKAAIRHLDRYAIDKKALPIQAWKDERARLIPEKQRLYREYATLGNEVMETQQIKNIVNEILREEKRRTQPVRMRGMER